MVQPEIVPGMRVRRVRGGRAVGIVTAVCAMPEYRDRRDHWHPAGEVKATVKWPSRRLCGDGWQRSTVLVRDLVAVEG